MTTTATPPTRAWREARRPRAGSRPPPPVTGWACPECARLAWPGYCAPRRCYCGHPECHAYPSWQPLRQLHAVPTPLQEDAQMTPIDTVPMFDTAPLEKQHT